MGKLIDLTSKRFSNLTVIHRSDSSRRGEAMWLCECDCGNKTIVRGYSLRNGDTTSCGCVQRMNASIRKAKHAQTNTRLYKIWCGMLCRCNNKNKDHYSNYGGRGISVCNEWRDFNIFAEWANNNGYLPHLTIDRINNDGNYSPENCRWVTQKEQMRNTSKNRVLSFNGQEASEAEWAERCGISKFTLSSRLRRGWSIEKALTEPVHRSTP